MIKYLKNHQKLYLYWGIFFTGMYCPWWPSALSFLSFLITGEVFNDWTYIFIGNIFIPLLLPFCILSFTELFLTEKKKSIMIIYSIISLFAEIYIIHGLATNYFLLGHLTDTFDIKYEPVMLMYLFLINFTVTGFGIIFSRYSINSHDPAINKRGWVLLFAFLTYPICGIIDAGINLNEIGIVFVRAILITGVILFYFGFVVSYKQKNKVS